MPGFEKMKPVAGIALVATTLALINSKFDLPGIPEFGGTTTEAKKFTSESQLEDLQNVEDILLVKGLGKTATTLKTEFKYTGARSVFNIVPGKAMSTTVSQMGELQIGVHAKGIVGDSKTKATNDFTKPYEVSVDSNSIFSQVVSSKATITEAKDGLLVRARSVLNPNESKRDKRGDELEHYGRISFENKCNPIALKVFDTGVKRWVRTQEQIDPKQRINITYIDKTDEPIDPTLLSLPRKQIKTPQQIVKDLYADNAEFKNVEEQNCTMTPKVADQIKQANGEPLEKPAV